MELTGKKVLITGATSGIGEAVAGRLASQVATLLVQGPQPGSEQRALIERLRTHGARVEYLQADFSRLSDVSELAHGVRERVGHLDLLVNNAVAPPARQRVVTIDGNELAWQVNYLAMVSLTLQLRDVVRERIVNISSETHRGASLDFDNLQLENGYEAFEAYRRSKLAIVTFTQWLARHLRDAGPAAVAICPGLTDTPLLHAMFPGSAGQPVSRAAANVIAGITQNIQSGTYMHDGFVAVPSAAATDPSKQAQLWEATAEMLGVPLSVFPN
ncbi:SDR family NAD(P)-dependent oxidoreductase [Promicromonospora sukumoe]|uniref:NAD(P)-dependent dehydrogenase (Short-subunit alcohol dehydrogenase family) n=1 Tax=Promicromonospora sukumoe TaxID=88382 RepID=A0A7W3PDL2_9MICO|nr:SDR family NAD(P)-dependent oxidoreductase [Promicromonospora sukumoe]MBA8807644.1 NAD(P)-dependent dehydrogenase (short-subunit alcohol dehydrogenase family) [Promicromonospora sukumoe]